MSKLLNYLAMSKFVVFIAWIVLLVPALVGTIYGDPFFLSLFYFFSLALYLRKVRNHLFLPTIIYIIFMLFPPYFYFIRWFIPFLNGEISFNEYRAQEYALFEWRAANFRLSNIFYVLLMPLSIYLINIRKELALNRSSMSFWLNKLNTKRRLGIFFIPYSIYPNCYCTVKC